jgi:hypothetical protein
MEPYRLTFEDFNEIRRMFDLGIVSSEDGAVKMYQKSGYDEKAKLQVNIWQQYLRIAENRCADE